LTGPEKKGYFFVFCTGVFFSLEVLGFKSIFQTSSASPVLLAFYGVLSAFGFLTPLLWGKKQSRERLVITFQRDGLALFLGTFLNSLGVGLYYTALRTSELGPAAVLVKMTAVFNVFFGILLLGETFGRRDKIGLTLAFLGVYFLGSGKGLGSWRSAVLVLVAAFFFSTQSYLIKRFAPAIFGLEFAYWRLGILSFFFFLYLLMSDELTTISWELGMKVGFYSFLGFFLGRAFYFEAHKLLPIGKLNSVMLLEPMVLLILGVLLWSEEVSFQKFFGAFCILVGIGLLVLHPRKSPEKS